jgi:hypothetical protein
MDTTELGNNTTTSLVDINKEAKFSLYPNPAKNNTNINFYSNKHQELEISLFNVIGKEIDKIKVNVLLGNNNISLDVTSLKNGVYFININKLEGKSIKLIVTK